MPDAALSGRLRLDLGAGERRTLGSAAATLTNACLNAKATCDVAVGGFDASVAAAHAELAHPMPGEGSGSGHGCLTVRPIVAVRGGTGGPASSSSADSSDGGSVVPRVCVNGAPIGGDGDGDGDGDDDDGDGELTLAKLSVGFDSLGGGGGGDERTAEELEELRLTVTLHHGDCIVLGTRVMLYCVCYNEVMRSSSCGRHAVVMRSS